MQEWNLKQGGIHRGTWRRVPLLVSMERDWVSIQFEEDRDVGMCLAPPYQLQHIPYLIDDEGLPEFP